MGQKNNYRVAVLVQKVVGAELKVLRENTMCLEEVQRMAITCRNLLFVLEVRLARLELQQVSLNFQFQLFWFLVRYLSSLPCLSLFFH